MNTMMLSKSLTPSKDLPTFLPFIVFLPVWILRCGLKFEMYIKEFPHLTHSKGFAPLQILWCNLSSSITKGRVTFLTYTWFLTIMNSSMLSKVWSTTKSFPTFFIEFLITMNDLMQKKRWMFPKYKCFPIAGYFITWFQIWKINEQTKILPFHGKKKVMFYSIINRNFKNLPQ